MVIMASRVPASKDGFGSIADMAKAIVDACISSGSGNSLLADPRSQTIGSFGRQNSLWALTQDFYSNRKRETPEGLDGNCNSDPRQAHGFAFPWNAAEDFAAKRSLVWSLG
jgi:hypothetical protein